MATETVAVVDPRTGVAFKPEEITDELLAEILVELQRREHQMTEWRRAAEDEMVRRAGDLPSVVVAGRQYDIERSMSRDWDVDDLAAEATRLVHAKLLTLKDVSGLIKERRTVDGNVAKRLLDKGSPEVVRALSGCFTWVEKGRARVKLAVPEIER